MEHNAVVIIREVGVAVSLLVGLLVVRSKLPGLIMR